MPKARLLNHLEVQSLLRSDSKRNVLFQLAGDRLHYIETASYEKACKTIVSKLISNVMSKNLVEASIVSLEQPQGMGKTAFLRHLSDYCKSLEPDDSNVMINSIKLRLKKAIPLTISFKGLMRNDENHIYNEKEILDYMLDQLVESFPQELFNTVLLRIKQRYTVSEMLNELKNQRDLSFLLIVDDIQVIGVEQIWELFAGHLFGTYNLFVCFSGIASHLSYFHEQKVKQMLGMGTQQPSFSLINPNMAMSKDNCPINLGTLDLQEITECFTKTKVYLSHNPYLPPTARLFTILYALGLKKIDTELLMRHVLQYTAGIPGLIFKFVKYILEEKPDLSHTNEWSYIISLAQSFVMSNSIKYSITDINTYCKLIALGVLMIPLETNSLLELEGKKTRLMELIQEFCFYYSARNDSKNPENRIILLKTPLFLLYELSIQNPQWLEEYPLFFILLDVVQRQTSTNNNEKEMSVYAIQRLIHHCIKRSLIEGALELKGSNVFNQINWSQICRGIFSDCFFATVELSISNSHAYRIPSLGLSNCSYMTGELQEDSWSHTLECNNNSLKLIAKYFLKENRFAVPEFHTSLIGDIWFALEADPEDRYSIYEETDANEKIITKFLVFQKTDLANSLSWEQIQEQLNNISKLRSGKKKEISYPTILNRDIHFCLLILGLDFSLELKQIVNKSCNSSGSLVLNSGRYKIDKNGLMTKRQKKELSVQVLHVPKGIQVVFLGDKGAKSLFTSSRLHALRSILNGNVYSDNSASNKNNSEQSSIQQTIFDMFSDSKDDVVQLSSEALQRKKYNHVRKVLSQHQDQLKHEYYNSKGISSAQIPFRNMPYILSPIDLLQERQAVTSVEKSASPALGLKMKYSNYSLSSVTKNLSFQ